MLVIFLLFLSVDCVNLRHRKQTFPCDALGRIDCPRRIERFLTNQTIAIRGALEASNCF